MRWAAMGVPMMPRPTNPTLLIELSPRLFACWLSCWSTGRRSGRLPESVTQGLAGGAEQAEVAADRHEGRAPVEIAAGVGVDAGQNASRLAGSAGARENVPYGILDVGMVGIAEMTEGGGEIGRA